MVEKTLALWRVETAKYVPLTQLSLSQEEQFQYRGPYIPPTGLEPVLPAPEAGALSN